MSFKIIPKNKIPEHLNGLLESDNITDRQKELWQKYIDFLNEDQLEKLEEFVILNKVSFDILMEELEKKAKIIKG